MLNTAVAVALLFSGCLSSIPGTAAVPFGRRQNAAEVVLHCTVPNTAALTFDDGPYIYMKNVVDTLEKANAVGTFFLNGNNWACIYDDEMVDRVKYAYGKGFQIGSHTWAHEHLPTLNADQVDSQMSQTEDAIRKITGAIPAFTRPPYGEYNDVTVQVATKRRQTLVNWDFDSGDSIGKTVDQQKELYRQVAAQHPSTILSLEHEVYNTSALVVLPYAIEQLQGAGYKLVTLAQCLGQEPYLQTGSPSARDDTWHC